MNEVPGEIPQAAYLPHQVLSLDPSAGLIFLILALTAPGYTARRHISPRHEPLNGPETNPLYPAMTASISRMAGSGWWVLDC